MFLLKYNISFVVRSYELGKFEPVGKIVVLFFPFKPWIFPPQWSHFCS